MPPVSLQALLDEVTQQDELFEAPGDPLYPRDLLPHPDMRAESFSLRAIIYPDNRPSDRPSDRSSNVPSDRHNDPPDEQLNDGRVVEAVAAVQASIGRVALRAGEPGSSVTNSDTSTDASSQWSFNSVMRVNVMTDAASLKSLSGGNDQGATGDGDTLLTLAQLAPRQSVQRAALKLAGVDERRLWVGADELSIVPRSGRQADCQVDYSWSSTLSSSQRAELKFSIDTCPRSLAISGLASWQKNAIAINGSIVTTTPMSPSDGVPGNALTNAPIGKTTIGKTTRVPVKGYAWVTYSWGNPPGGVGAVVFDTLTLRLDNGDVLDVNRSKRLSGTGPSTITSTLYSNGAAPREISVDWQDDNFEQAASGQTYPRTIRLIAEDGSLTGSVTLLNRLQENTGAGNSFLSVAVTFQGEGAGEVVGESAGEGEGVGFLSYTPVNTPL